MTLDNHTDDRSPLTVRAIVAGAIRAVANWISSETIAAPSIDDIREHEARAVERALLAAQSDEERARHTVNMLRERLGRLTNESSDPPYYASFGR